MTSEKLLTISARDYAESKGKKLTDYNFIGVGGHALGSLESGINKAKKNLIEKIEKLGAEVLVDGRMVVAETDKSTNSEGDQAVYFFGTALIPK